MKPALRICHLTSVHSARDTRIFLKQCRSLAGAGYETHLVAPGSGECVCDGVHVHGVPGAPGGRLGRMTLTTRRVFQAARAIDADLYHFHDPELIPTGLTLRAHGKRVIYDAHEDLPRDLLSKSYMGRSKRLVAWASERFENAAARRFSGIVAATAAIGMRFARVNPNTVVVANYPLVGELATGASTPWRQRPRSAAYLGGVSVIRGIRETVWALERLSSDQQVTLDVAGAFKEAAERAVVSQLAGWVYVKEHGVLDRGGVASLLGSVRCGLVVWHPVAHQVVAQPIKLYEYMAAGIPVIASDFPLWREIVVGNRCGLVVDPMDPDAIAEALRYLMTNDGVAEEMGRRGQEAIKDQYNWESQFRTLTGLYDGVLAAERDGR